MEGTPLSLFLETEKKKNERKNYPRWKLFMLWELKMQNIAEKHTKDKFVQKEKISVRRGPHVAVKKVLFQN